MASVHIAVVRAPDGVRLVAACRTERELLCNLSAYVTRRAARQLWPADAQRVRSLAAGGALEAAVDFYFARVGERWDSEELLKVALDESSTAEPRHL
jgi:hypothetical protein